MRIFSASLLAFLVSFGAQAFGAQAFGAQTFEVKDVKSRGVTTRLLVEKGDNPFVTLVLFAGGKGIMDISDNGFIGWGLGNFLVRSRRLFWNQGAITAVIDAPMDKRKTLHGFRNTKNHAKDVGAVVSHLRAKYGLPVWLVGTSRGTNSVANAALRLKSNKPDGIVLLATMLAYKRQWGGDWVTNMDINKIELPVLIAHHKKDKCIVTPPGKVSILRKKLKNAKPVKVLWYEGGIGVRGNECEAQHYHGFKGIEKKVVSDIMGWIKSQTP